MYNKNWIVKFGDGENIYSATIKCHTPFGALQGVVQNTYPFGAYRFEELVSANKSFVHAYFRHPVTGARVLGYATIKN